MSIILYRRPCGAARSEHKNCRLTVGKAVLLSLFAVLLRVASAGAQSSIGTLQGISNPTSSTGSTTLTNLVVTGPISATGTRNSGADQINNASLNGVRDAL